ncbi:hypothetical protein V8G54_026085 [Vigna mungo]|uniref:Uncharacterized protein n=1 Tax=Vigna mungo TaxID=3915 RepID=A0AAQ3RQ64_VIGMU
MFLSSFLVWHKDILDQRFLDGKKLRELFLQFGSIHLIVAPWSYDHLGLLFKVEVDPLEAWINVIPVHLKNLVVAHCPRICEVPDAPQVSLRHLNRNRQKFIQNGHAVWNVDHFVITRNLGDEVTWITQVG